MIVATSRGDFEKLAALRLKEARLLIEDGDWDGAYYLAGYAVECALKIVVISRVVQSDSFHDKSLVDIFYRHDLTHLRRAAGLEHEMDQDPKVAPQWDIVKDWSEQSRYELGTTEREARDLYEAIEGGVLPWIKARW